MTLMNNKPSTTTQVEEQTTMIITFNQPAWTLEQIFTECEVSKKALILIAEMKAVLTTGELCNEFMNRIPHKPSGSNIHALLDEMREEQLKTNSMQHDVFLDMYLLNPIAALIQYFKHSVSTAHLERIRLWGINIKDVVRLKQLDNNIHLNDVLEKLYGN
ncbi:hypothetical protein J2W91_003511 [Paenibacillus amylolyticus]|uniref:Uncharacterized protein n=1 Tax=Paenibacillus amylolyticus TaxID=1451 RepID=A0AAP5H2D5_PAEAM|nr:hypothetical protein [Paenibacillus amylolyticus]MDR6725025.1 hypothetical protein [Paenibacillus amylolyticus]